MGRHPFVRTQGSRIARGVKKKGGRLSCVVHFDADDFGWMGKIFCDESALDIPLHWKKPRRIFVCSMGDLLHKSVPFEFIDRVVNVFEKCPQHTGQLLTKRARRLLDYSKYRRNKGLEWPDNIIGMVTAGNQEMAALRIPLLLQCGFKTTGVSVEPMLGAVDLHSNGGWNYLLTGNTGYGHGEHKIDWVIIGCESGPKRRECKIEWVQDLVRQCKAAGVAVFVKQLSINGKVSRNMSEWPEDLRVQEYPKKGE